MWVQSFFAPSKRAKLWVRDLTEEGIEPHPGPRFCTKNLDGGLLSGGFARLIRTITTAHTRKPFIAVAFQEHQLDAAKTRLVDPVTTADRLGVLWLQADAPNQRTCQCQAPCQCPKKPKGGTAIAIPHTAIELNKDESLQQAISRIKASAKVRGDGRMITVEILINGANLSG